jgi:hypothetical protein
VRLKRWCAGLFCAPLVVYGSAVQSGFAGECGPPAWIEPLPGTTTSQARPKLVWKSHPGVSRHRLRLTSRIPEGEVKVSLDTVVDSEIFVPPASLTDYRAKVTIGIRPDCAGDASVGEQEVQFHIDTSGTCEVSAPRIGDDGTVVWLPTTNATEYEMYVYRMPEGALARKYLSREAAYVLPLDLQNNAVVALRARCPSGYGELRYLHLK